MIESFVDLTYRGLPLGRRVKLTQVRPSTGYLEMPTPMPVGTAIAVVTDEGVLLDALVTSIHEQVGGSDRPPGMTVAPKLADPAAQSWWSARVALPEEPPPAPRTKGVTVRPRSHTVPSPAVGAEMSDAPETTDVGPPPTPPTDTPPDTIREPALRDSSPSLGRLRSTGQHEVVDDGKMTMLMDAVDPAALGLDTGDDDAADAADSSDAADANDANGSDEKKITASGTVKKRKKKR